MPKYAFDVVKTHSTLTSIAAPGKTRVVPAHVANELSQIDSPEAAGVFLTSAGLEEPKDTDRSSNTAYTVTMSDCSDQYFGIQVVFPKIHCDLIPAGSLLVNCLIPDVNIFEAERILGLFIRKIEAISNKLEASPFACITGNKTGGPLNALHLRGFRFFFSPDPDPLFKRIKDGLDAMAQLGSPPAGTTRMALADRVQNLKFCESASGIIAHSILEDIKTYNARTNLVDMR